MSTDPSLRLAGTLGNPQRWNRYGYASNSPLIFIDSDGKAQVEFTLRAFIPQGQVAGFRGDNRAFTAAAEASSRTSITIKIETDPAKRGGANPMIGKPDVKIGQTHLDLPIGTFEKKATGPSLPSASAAYDKNGNTVVQINQNVQNPLAPGSLGIRSDLTVTIPKDASSISVQGTVSGSPSFEMNVSVENSATQNIQLQQAAQDSTSFVSNLQETVDVKVEQPLEEIESEEEP